jgi:hypothetical protein
VVATQSVPVALSNVQEIVYLTTGVHIMHMRPSHLKFQSWIQDGGRGTHVTHFVHLYPQPQYTASQVRTTSRSWDKGVLTDLCLTLYTSALRPVCETFLRMCIYYILINTKWIEK